MSNGRKLTPGEQASAIVRSAEEERALVLRQNMKPANEETYWCSGCGFVDMSDPSNVRHPYPAGLTLRFSPEEIAALGGDLSAYTGPCPVCNYQTLVPKDLGFGMTSGMERHRAERMAEYKEQADVQADVLVTRLKQEVVGMAGGSIFDQAGGAAAGDWQDDLPDAETVDTSKMRAR